MDIYCITYLSTTCTKFISIEAITKAMKSSTSYVDLKMTLSGSEFEISENMVDSCIYGKQAMCRVQNIT